MDTRLVFAVLLVTLCWFSVGTYAQNTTASTATNATTASNTATNATIASNTTTNATTASNTTTATNATTASNTTTATNATTASNTTTATNATTASDTTTATIATTTSGNSTALTPNVTVAALQTNISRTGCGSEFLCASEPSSCDPSGSGCFFFSAKQQNNQTPNNFDLALAGESDGYVAATLSTDTTLGGNDTTYVCANDNGTVKFIPAVLDNNQLTAVSELNVNTVKGKIIGNIIQCTFAATVPSSSTRSTSLTLAISTGSFNSTTGSLGAPTNKLKSSSVNLANPNATVVNELSNTTSSAITFKQSLTQALLISAGMVGLTLL